MICMCYCTNKEQTICILYRIVLHRRVRPGLTRESFQSASVVWSNDTCSNRALVLMTGLRYGHSPHVGPLH